MGEAGLCSGAARPTGELVMSAENKDVFECGQNGPSGEVLGGIDAVLPLAGHLAQFAAGLGGRLKPEAAVHIALRSSSERRDLLEQVIAEITPSHADEALWVGWISGEGPSPFQLRTKQPGPGEERPAQTLKRASDRVKKSADKVEKAKLKLAAAQREVEEAERLLLETHNLESAALQWHVVSQLFGVVAPVFAMGPAWTVMRSLSGHLSDTQAEAETFDLIGKEKERAVEAMRSARKAETVLLMEVLDLGSGNEKFEGDVRSAVLKVCKDWDKKRDRLTVDGRRPRSAEKAKKEVHPKALGASDEVLHGLRVSG